MLNNGNRSHCGFADEIVSYIYNETGESQRKIFETHLADCMSCTDEFAAISNARFSVFEWQKEEFAHLPTPEIVIPYAQKQRIIEEAGSTGFLAGLRGLLSLSGMPVAIAAALVVCIGLGFLAMNYLGGRQNDPVVAGNRNLPTVDPRVEPVKNIDPEIPLVNASNTPDGDVIRAAKNGPAKRDVHFGTVANNRQQKQDKLIRIENRKFASDVAVQNPSVQPRKPVLSTDVDTDDRSLRLADLVDDDGGGS